MSANVTDVNTELGESKPLMSSTPPPPPDRKDLSSGGDGAARAADPFYHFKESLEEKMDVLENAVAVHLSLVKTTDTTKSPEYPASKKRLKKLTKACESTLKDLSSTLRVVENDRAQFSHIDDLDLDSRTHFVSGMSSKLFKIKSDQNSDTVTKKLLADERAAAASKGGNLGATDKFSQGNTEFVYDQQANAQMMMRRQDETLGELDGAVDRVGNIAIAINEE